MHAQSLQRQLDRVEKESLTDHLTTLANRKAAEERLEDLFNQYQEENESFSVVIMDIDHFKSFNDTYGHNIGDAVLRKVSHALRDTLKGSDFPARFGGEEFIVLLPNTPLAPACRVAELLRAAISSRRLKLSECDTDLGSVTASFGVSEIQFGDTMESLVERADQALYLAKNSGRDNVKSQAEL